MSSVAPYSGSLRSLPLRNRAHEGVADRIAHYEREYGPMEDLHLAETPHYNTRERRGWMRLSLCAVFGGVSVCFYSCDEGDHCNVSDAPAFRASIAEATGAGRRDCPACRGTGGLGQYNDCPSCDGNGVI
jgi:hypothetical protein